MKLRTDPQFVISHWHQLIEGLSASSTAFFDTVESALKLRAVPDIHISRIEYHEAGLMSAKRLYLHVQHGRQVFDVCAAPFGTGFFISSWLAETKPALPVWARIATVLGLLSAFVFCVVTMGVFDGPVVFVILVLLGLCGIHLKPGDDHSTADVVAALPLIGRVFQWLFLTPTYYAIDTALMFRDAVHNSVLEAVDGLTTEHGLRALSEAERRPIQRDFLLKAS